MNMHDERFMYQLKALPLTTDDIFGPGGKNGHHNCIVSQQPLVGIAFADGREDNWCIYRMEQNSDGSFFIAIPSDTYYFERLYWLGCQMRYGNTLAKVYGHVWRIFEHARSYPDDKVFAMIERMAALYGPFSGIAKECFTLVYYGMIAEENHAGTKVGRLIKIQGLYNLLMRQMDVSQAANCMRYRGSAADVQAQCDALGLFREV